MTETTSAIAIDSVEIAPMTFSVAWSVTGAGARRFARQPLTVTYDQSLVLTEGDAIASALALLVPLASADSSRVVVRCAVPIGQSVREYWAGILRMLRIADTQLDFDAPMAPDAVTTGASTAGRVALLFGGGIESLFALSLLEPLDPLLMSIVGPRWMNNDTGRFVVKQTLEERMQRETGVALHRITSNAFAITTDADLQRNRWVTGLLFYWHALPLCRALGVHTLYKSSELEEALNFEEQDLSLQPRFIADVAPGIPLMLPVFNCFSKIQMFESLARTKWLEYVYSCFHNTERRWCGECTKCYRISEYCDHLGIDRRRLGMQEGISGKVESGPISAHYWRLAARLYPLPMCQRLRRTIRQLVQRWA